MLARHSGPGYNGKRVSRPFPQDVGRIFRERRARMAREVHAGLTSTPRSIPPKYFYDARGSKLFDAICELPEYYLTRAERELLVAHADDVVGATGATALVEIGSGMARKTGLLVRALCARHRAPLYAPFDIAQEALDASARSLQAECPTLNVQGIVGDFGTDLPLLARALPPAEGPRLFAFLGSTIGNLDEEEAPALVRGVAAAMAERDAFLLGADLVKDERVLHAAYNDARGVTAEFNRNVLRVVSHELDGDFDERAFDHLAFYEPGRQRIEMHLVARSVQRVTIRDIDLSFELAAGERILTEISRKFTRETVEHTLTQGGMRLERWIAADDGAFALAVARKSS
ncbi:MAG TPA: L-histidine N(alpha)-methyltransferase [Polyangiaceae bacterium]